MHVVYITVRLVTSIVSITIYGKTFEGGNIHGFCNYAANRKCFPLEYFCAKTLKL